MEIISYGPGDCFGLIYHKTVILFLAGQAVLARYHQSSGCTYTCIHRFVPRIQTHYFQKYIPQRKISPPKWCY